MKTYFEKGGDFLAKHGVNATVEQKADISLNVVSGLLASLLVITKAAPGAAAIQPIVAEAQQNVAETVAMISSIPTGDKATIITSVSDTLGNISTGISGLIAAGHITDAPTTARVNAIVAAVNGEFKDILAGLAA